MRDAMPLTPHAVHDTKKPDDKQQRDARGVAAATSTSNASVLATSLETDRAVRRGPPTDQLEAGHSSSCPAAVPPVSNCMGQIDSEVQRQLPNAMSSDWTESTPPTANALLTTHRPGSGELAEHSAAAAAYCASLLPILYFAMNYYAFTHQPAAEGDCSPTNALEEEEQEQNGQMDSGQPQQQQQQQQPQQQQPPVPAASSAMPVTVGRQVPADSADKQQPAVALSPGFFIRPSASLQEVLQAAPACDEALDVLARRDSVLSITSSLASSTNAAPAPPPAHGREQQQQQQQQQQPSFMRESMSLEELLSCPWGLQEHDRSSSGYSFAARASLPAATNPEPVFGRASFAVPDSHLASAWPAL